MSHTVPPMPYKSQFVDMNGALTEPWSKWIREVFSRIGGPVALTNIELANLSNSQLATLTASITALQSSLAALTAIVTANTSDLNGLHQGRQL